jgi:hypothetical protein
MLPYCVSQKLVEWTLIQAENNNQYIYQMFFQGHVMFCVSGILISSGGWRASLSRWGISIHFQVFDENGWRWSILDTIWHSPFTRICFVHSIIHFSPSEKYMAGGSRIKHAYIFFMLIVVPKNDGCCGPARWPAAILQVVDPQRWTK